MKNIFCGYEVHPIANLFPMMTEDEFDKLKEDIREHGQVMPIYLFGGRIIDGRNRAMACSQLSMVPIVETLDVEDPISWAISMNARRRHLTKSQLSAIGVDALPLYEAQARERMLAGVKLNPEVKIPQGEKREPQSRDLAAAATGVSASYIQTAKKIKEESPETFEKVKAGEVTLADAKRMLFETATIPEPPDVELEDQDSDELFQLKRIWKAATKKDRKAFLKWVNER